MILKYVEYKLIIENKFDCGDIDYERYCFLIDKLSQWYHVYSEMREDD